MNNRETLASLEIADHEIRLIVAEWHNLKFNVLKVERVECSGINKIEIANPQVVISCIQKAINNASKLIGAPIKRVILLIPSYHLDRVAKRVVVSTKTGEITTGDIREAIRTGKLIDIGNNQEIVSINPYRYIVNGNSVKKAPIGEKADSVAVEIEVLSCDKNIVYQYVMTVEQAGVEVLDIVVDNYALALEAALFAKTIENYILLVKLERQTTSLSLLAANKLVNSTILDVGFGEIIGTISDTFKLRNDIAARLLLHNLHVDEENLPTSPVYYWTVDNTPNVVSEAQLSQVAMPEIERWVKQIKDISLEILQTGNVEVVIGGEGAEMMNLDKYFAKILDVKTTTYIPETLGIRTSSLATCFGAMYAYRDQKDYKSSYKVSIDDLGSSLNAQAEKTKSNKFKKIFANKGE